MNKLHVRGCLVVLLVALCATGRADEIVVSAAASLTESLNEIGAAYTKSDRRTAVRFNFGASGTLRQQIVQGARVDVFASASPREMDALQQARRIESATRTDFAGNRLVLIVPAQGRVRGWDDLRTSAVRRVAFSNPAYVPSGTYARQTLTRRGLWPSVQPKSVVGENVRQTLTYVATGDVDAGIVFATDAQVRRGRVRVAARAKPGRDHDPIVYPAAVVAGAPNAPAARRFVAFLRSPTARAIFARHGFTHAHTAPHR